jgi:hypothetical protein
MHVRLDQSGHCNDDSPRKGEIARAQAEQGAGVLKGIADVLGVGAPLRGAAQAAQAATASMARCPKDGTLAPWQSSARSARLDSAERRVEAQPAVPRPDSR